MTSTSWADEHRSGWSAALAELRAEGWQAELTCFAAPVQIEGTLPSGEPFYFRARHDEVSLSLGGDDPVDMPDCEHTETHPEASHLPAGDGLAVIRRLTQLHRAHPPSTE